MIALPASLLMLLGTMSPSRGNLGPFSFRARPLLLKLTQRFTSRIQTGRSPLSFLLHSTSHYTTKPHHKKNKSRESRIASQTYSCRGGYNARSFSSVRGKYEAINVTVAVKGAESFPNVRGMYVEINTREIAERDNCEKSRLKYFFERLPREPWLL